MGCRSYGLSELWVVGVMGRRNRDLTPCLLYPEHLVPLLIWILTSCPFYIIWSVLLANAR